VSSQEDLAVFDELFEQFFSVKPEPPPDSAVPALEEAEAEEDMGEEDLRPTSQRWEMAPAEEASEEEGLPNGYSPNEALMVKEFGQFPPEEQEALGRELLRLLSRIASRVSRRRKPSSRGREVHFPRTMRKAVRYGGEILDLVRRRRKIKPMKVIVICDVSGSMDTSTRFILQFFFGLQKVFPRSETLVFSTQLTRITDILRQYRWGEALTGMGKRVQDWSGGTKIGQSLQAFNERYARTLAAQSAVIILISDGWDRGDADLLAEEMKRLRRKARRVIWMNPLLASPEYRPLCQGMRTALPYVDDFLPASTLQGLKKMGDILTTEMGRR
ncbi:MAG TPA: VWA domain-containing protein, partial [Candidatus Acidoferrum sp.]|nr:VWA domain-containing protein [Candidatus Acidoferrum sp.]